MTLRRQDYSLDERQAALGRLLRSAPATGVDGADLAPFDLVDLVIGARGLARSGRDVAFVASAAVRRTLARVAGSAVALDRLTDAGSAAFCVGALPGARQTSVLCGPRATDVVGLVGEELCLDRLATDLPADRVGVRPWLPSAGRQVLAEGERARAWHGAAVREWRLLAAAEMIGRIEALLEETVARVSTRSTMGVPLGSLQGVAFPLADVEVSLRSTEALVLRAAWFLEHEPGERDDLAEVAWLAAVDMAIDGSGRCAQLQGVHGYLDDSFAARTLMSVRATALAGGARDDLLASVGRDAVRRLIAGSGSDVAEAVR